MLYWLPVYLEGLWTYIYYPDYLCKKKNNSCIRISLIALFLCYFVIVYSRVRGIGYVSYYKYLMWFIAPALLINISDAIPLIPQIENLYDSEFLIYCAHEPIIHILASIMMKYYVPETNAERIIQYYIVVFGSFVICSLLYFLLKNKKLSGVCKVMYGRW